MKTDNQVSVIFHAIATRPEVFSAKPELKQKAARDIVVAQLKEKAFNLSRMREIALALGRECTLAVLEELPHATLSSLLGKLDKVNKDRAEEGRFAVSHLLALAFGEVEPQPGKSRTPKSDQKKQKPEKEVVRLLHQSKVLGRKR